MGKSVRTRGLVSGKAAIMLTDLCRKMMQLSGVVLVLVAVYLLWGLMAGGIGAWESLGAQPSAGHAASSGLSASQVRIAGNVQTACFVFNVALVLLVLSVCVLHHDEESAGYTLVLSGVFLYFGVPILMDTLAAGQMGLWERQHNLGALGIFSELRVAAIILSVPGVGLTLRDLVRRVARGTGRRRDSFTAMQYGGSTTEEAPPSPAVIGVMGRCWQLAFCREFIRASCPIFLARTRCWRKRVGCMCEESVVRTAVTAMMAESKLKDESPVNFAAQAPDDRRIDLDAPIDGLKPKPVAPPKPRSPQIAPKDVRIPQNPNLSPAQKRERCRNCVIYNEHQRLKYQAVAPLVLLAVPLTAWLKADLIAEVLKQVLKVADKAMSSLSLAATEESLGLLQHLNSTGMIAEYLMLGCLVIIFTTAMLRFLEYCVFQIKV